MAGKYLDHKYAQNAYNRTCRDRDRPTLKRWRAISKQNRQLPNATVHLRLRWYICLGAQSKLSNKKYLHLCFLSNKHRIMLKIWTYWTVSVSRYYSMCMLYYLSFVKRDSKRFKYVLFVRSKFHIEMIAWIWRI